MNGLSFILISISIFTHAYWNFLIKSSENKHVFSALSKVSEVVIFAIPAIYFLLATDLHADFLWLISIASIITFSNYYFLSVAYKNADLSLVYPISRSSVLFLPLFAYVFIGETLDTLGTISVLLILLGAFIMHMDSLNIKGITSVFLNLKRKGSAFALLAAASVAGYTLWDKVAVTKTTPFLYFYSYTVLISLFYNFFIWIKFSKNEIKREWVLNKPKIVQVGFLNSCTYILVLTALTTSKATYVGGLRQLSIAVGVLLGYRLLNEQLSIPKIIGIVILVLGGSLIYLAK